jgi:hypothetical protein
MKVLSVEADEDLLLGCQRIQTTPEVRRLEQRIWNKKDYKKRVGYFQKDTLLCACQDGGNSSVVPVRLLLLQKSEPVPVRLSGTFL